MTNPYLNRRRHYRTAQREIQNPSLKSLIELDFNKTTLLVGLIALIQGLIFGLALRRK
ncbi:MAG: hypothetical protein ACOCRK_03370 [bacterium]